MKNWPVIHFLTVMVSLLPLAITAQQIDRTVLPVPEPKPPTITELDARDAKAPPRFEVKAPKGAPNVVVVLLDDIGFGQSSAFGGRARCQHWISWRRLAFVITIFIPPRFVRGLAPRC